MFAIDDPIICSQLAGYERLQTPIWIFDIQHLTMRWANRAALLLWNATSLEELLSRDFSQVSTATYTRLQSYLEQFEQGETVIEQWTFYPGENAISVRCTCSGIFLENGSLAMLVEAEKIANLEPDTLRSVEALRHTTVIISLCNEAGELLFQNPAAITCYGNHISHPENQHLKQRFFNQNIWLQAEQELIARGRFNADIQVLTKQGVRWHSLEICQTKDPINGCNMLLVNEHDITALKQTEEKLRWKQTLLRSMTNASPLAFYVVDNRTDQILYFNPQFCQIWGIEHLTQEMQSGQVKNNDVIAHCVDILLDVAAFAETCKPLQNEENRAIVEDEIPFRDGRIIRRFSTQICDQDDRYFGRLYIFEDITERKRIEEQLKLADFSVENSSLATVWIDRNARILRTNKKACEQYGCSREELLSMQAWDADPNFSKAAWPAHWEELKRQKTMSFTSEHHTKDGTTIPVEITLSYLDFNGKEYNFASARDISDQVEVEKALRQNEERMQALLKAIPDTMFRHRVDGTYLDVQANENSLILPPEVLIGKNLIDLPIPEHIKIGLLKNFQAAVATGKLQTFEHDLEKPDGMYIYEARIIKSGADEIVCIVRDITERKQVEEVLQKALAAAQAASISKSRFLSHMSHELRTPLNAILGFSQVMARSNSLSSEQQEQLKIINRSGEHLLNLINDILSMSKIEAGQVTVNENRFDLYQLLEDIEQMLCFKADAKGLQLIFERAANVPQYIETDESKLRQILINLLGNALKFTNEGSIYLRAKLGNREQDKSLIIFEVEDTGPGIAPEEISTMFDPFVQTETGRQSMQGTGLGLPISRQFVRLMGGDIIVQSQLGKGTIFTFDIRFKQVVAIPEKSSLTPKQVIGLQPNQPTYRILIVEDIAENRLLLVKLLKPLGFEVQEAVNGQEAIALWSTWQPHLIWMDMRMPIIDGYEATKQIKALQQQRLTIENIPKTVIIALTASAFEEEQSSIFSVGCDDLVCKPFQELELFEKMAQYLGVRYIYADKNQSASLNSATPKKLQIEDLKVMPTQWIEELHQAVLCVNDDIILELVKQIPETEAALANTLTDLVNNFRLDLILKLTETLIPSDQ
ncbi:MAG: PAS domain S-box protein [Phormidium sp.]